MNMDELQRIWGSPDNRPSGEERTRLIGELNGRLRRQRQRHLGWLIWAFFQLVIITAFVSWLIFGSGKLNPGAEWGVILLLTVPWSVALFYLKQYRDPAVRDLGNTDIAASLEAADGAIRAARLRLKALGLMYLILTPVTGLCMQQLHAAGKMDRQELISMASLFGGAIVLSAAAVAAWYYLRLLPQQRQLTSILTQYRRAAGEK